MVEWMYRSTFSSALAGGEKSASCTSCFTPMERAPGTYWIGGWVDARAGLDNVERRKFLTTKQAREMLYYSSHFRHLHLQLKLI
jgi:hypothetical protein